MWFKERKSFPDLVMIIVIVLSEKVQCVAIVLTWFEIIYHIRYIRSLVLLLSLCSLCACLPCLWQVNRPCSAEASAKAQQAGFKKLLTTLGTKDPMCVSFLHPYCVTMTQSKIFLATGKIFLPVEFLLQLVVTFVQALCSL